MSILLHLLTLSHHLQLHEGITHLCTVWCALPFSSPHKLSSPLNISAHDLGGPSFRMELDRTDTSPLVPRSTQLYHNMRLVSL